jgi:hypothetical protein
MRYELQASFFIISAIPFNKTIKNEAKTSFYKHLNEYRSYIMHEGLQNIHPYSEYIQLFQSRLSPSKAEKSNTRAEGLLGIAKKSEFFSDSQQAFRACIRFSRFTRGQP